MLTRYARASIIGATWLALAFGPIAVGQAAVDPSGQSIRQGAGGQTVTQPGQCVAPTVAGRLAVAQGTQNAAAGTCPVTPAATAPPALPAPMPCPAGQAGTPPNCVRPPVLGSPGGDGCASLVSRYGMAKRQFDKLTSHKGRGRSYAKKKHAAEQKAADALSKARRVGCL